MKRNLVTIIILLLLVFVVGCYSTEQLWETQIFVTQTFNIDGVEYVKAGDLGFQCRNVGYKFQAGEVYDVLLRRTREGGWELEEVVREYKK